jgi:hypothetical protein
MSLRESFYSAIYRVSKKIRTQMVVGIAAARNSFSASTPFVPK